MSQQVATAAPLVIPLQKLPTSEVVTRVMGEHHQQEGHAPESMDVSQQEGPSKTVAFERTLGNGQGLIGCEPISTRVGPTTLPISSKKGKSIKQPSRSCDSVRTTRSQSTTARQKRARGDGELGAEGLGNIPEVD